MHLAQAAFALITLPYEAFSNQDAIVRTIWRMLISRKKLLEWNPSNFLIRNRRINLLGSYRTMWVSSVIAILTIFYFEFSKQAVPAIIFPILFLWAASPLITWWISLPLAGRPAKLSITQKIFLRNLSRKTWSFFETFVGPEDNWLPPDNYQEKPVAVIAHRTSPTNMGLSLLANLSAYDFGYITVQQFIVRYINTFHTMETLGRYQGHFCNWYDTKTLMPLRPFYISSVDSGNLAAHLLTLRQGILALPNNKIVVPQLFEGISDTLRILISAAMEIDKHRLDQLQKDLESIINLPPATLTEAWQCLDKLATSTSIVENDFIKSPENQAARWATALAKQCRSALDELTFFAPWLVKPDFLEIMNCFHGTNSIFTLSELANLDTELIPFIDSSSDISIEENNLSEKLKRLITEASKQANERITVINHLAKQSGELSNMEYNFLYDKTRHLMSVGYSIDEKRRDSSYYDLLASEARLSIFVGIAQGQLPQESWFALGRLLTNLGR